MVMTIIGILAAVIFVSIGNQRKNAKVNGALQSANSNVAIGHECYFRLKGINTPNNGHNPSNEICDGSHAQWNAISVDICAYNTAVADGSDYYEIICADAGKKIFCGVSPANAGCSLIALP